MSYTLDKEEAIKKCKENGEDPFDWLDYADLRNDKQRWEYFMPKEEPKIDASVGETETLWAQKQSYKLKLELYQNRCETLTAFVEEQFGCDLEGINNDDVYGYLQSKI
jgi:hypothetical protein